MASSKEDAPGGRADWGSGVMMGEFDPFAGKTVDIGSFDFFLSVAAEFSVAEVIGEDEDDIRLLLLGGGEGGGCEERDDPLHENEGKHGREGNEL